MSVKLWIFLIWYCEAFSGGYLISDLSSIHTMQCQLQILDCLYKTDLLNWSQHFLNIKEQEEFCLRSPAWNICRRAGYYEQMEVDIAWLPSFFVLQSPGLCSVLTTTGAFQYYTLSPMPWVQTSQPERYLGLDKLHKSIQFCLKRWNCRLEKRFWVRTLRAGFSRDVGETLAPSTVGISVILNIW